MVGVQEVSFKKETISGLRVTSWCKKNGFKIAKRIKTLDNEVRGLVGC